MKLTSKSDLVIRKEKLLYLQVSAFLLHFLVTHVLKIFMFKLQYSSVVIYIIIEKQQHNWQTILQVLHRKQLMVAKSFPYLFPLWNSLLFGYNNIQISLSFLALCQMPLLFIFLFRLLSQVDHMSLGWMCSSDFCKFSCEILQKVEAMWIYAYLFIVEIWLKI